jgi:DNA-binding response OmpR family regulator
LTPPKRILLVEDDADLSTQIQSFLTTKGYQVEVAIDGNEAVRKAREAAPQLILLDALLPKMSGFQVARLLKFDEKSKEIPILMLTVLRRPADQEKAKSVGVNLFLTKPFSEELLLKSIEQLIG